MNIQSNTGSLGNLKVENVSIQQVIDPCPSFTPISLPNAEYQSSTTKIDISGIAELSSVSSISDGIQTVTFSTPMQRRQVGSSWLTWSSPPFSEDPAPPILYTQGATTLTMDLSVSSRVFGFELEPNPFASYEFTAVFLSGGIAVGSITRTVDGNAGARLFAAEIDCTCPAIDRVVITGPVDFAIAQVRYTPECSSQCTDRTIPFSCTVELPSICSFTLCTPTAFVCADIDCFVGQCETEVMIDVCQGEPGIPCCVTLDTLNFTGSAEIVVNIPAKITVCDGVVLTKDLMCVATVDISQTCFACAGTADCASINPCDLLSVTIQSTVRDGNQLKVTGIVEFQCPES